MEQAPAGSILHATGDEGVPTRAIAEVIGRRLNLPTASISRDHTDDHFGWLARFFGSDIAASSTLSRVLLGWQPNEPGLLEDLDSDHYFRAGTA